MSQFVPSQRLIVDDSITTGQAVTLEITPASPVLRVAAAMVDIFVTIALAVGVISAATSLALEPSDSMMRVYMISFVVFFALVLPMSVEFLTRGRSLGKWALGLQVVRDDGGVITLRHSMVRAVVGLPELWLTGGGVALVTTMLNLRSKRLGDLAAGTMVIRQPEHIAFAALLMPPDAYAWASTAQITRLPDVLVQRATMFVRSAYTLPPDVRYETALGIASELFDYVEPKPPADLHPERFIAAVLVVNRDRDSRKLQRWEQSAQVSKQRTSRQVFGI